LNIALLTVFVPTFFFVSITPGLCMTLAMTMGMTIGIRRALWMMAGELVGVALVAVLAAVGVAALLLNYPTAFNAFKIMGGLYLGFMGVQMWLSRGKMAIKTDVSKGRPASRTELALQGFMTAVSNPKGWAFFVALLPPFLSPDSSLFNQLLILVSIILVLEFICLLIYASGGVTLRSVLMQNSNVRLMNRIAGSLMIAVGLWLAVG
jgi:homoserine/homoserine lactone efflux protein